MFELELKKSEKERDLLEAIDVSDAIDKLYTYPNDSVELSISEFKIRLPLVHVFSSLHEDFLNIVTDVYVQKEGTGIYGFSQNDIFDADWEMKWIKDEVGIVFQWRNVNSSYSNGTPAGNIQISKSKFIDQWRLLFEQIIQDLSGVQLEYDDELIQMKNVLGKD